MHARVRNAMIVAMGIALSSSLAGAQESRDLADLSLEELLATEVSIASRREEDLIGVAAAISVVTREDIRRSGARSLPDALRLVPGVQVARIHSNAWAISARGFAGRLADKLLVMIDGRSIYTPTFSGVHWEAQDLLLEDVERIEVIRGPGGTLWGSNAVNGVINIVTRSAQDTRGSYVAMGGGSQLRGSSMGRVGGGDEDRAWRVWAKFDDQAGFEPAGGERTHGDFRHGTTGFRVDGRFESSATWQVQGELFRGDAEEIIVQHTLGAPYTVPRRLDSGMHGAHLLSQLHVHRHGEWTLRGYVDDAGRSSNFLDEHRQTFDFDLQHAFGLGRHQLLWGGGARHVAMDVDDTDFVRYEGDDSLHLWTAFVQDGVHFLRDRLQFTAGMKYEDHSCSDSGAWQPSARAAWVPSGSEATWAAISRAIRAPSAFDGSFAGIYGVLPPTAETMDLPLAIELQPGHYVTAAENVVATEIGHRRQLDERWQLDLSLYHHRYENLTSFSLLPLVPRLDGPTPHLQQPVVRANAVEGESMGGELSVAWQARPDWRLRMQYALTSISLRPIDEESTLFETDWRNEERGTPRHQVQLISWLGIGDRWEFDNVVTVYSRNHAYDIAPWIRWDVRVGVGLTPEIDLDVVGENLLRSGDREWLGNLGEVESQPGRAVYVGFSWRTN